MTSDQEKQTKRRTYLQSLWRGKSPRKITNYLSFLFDGVQLDGASMLDIGAGSGKYSAWAAINGADVTALEPESAGSRAGSLSKMEELIKELDIHNCHILSETFQSLDPGDKKFDIILSYASINHLDERAVQILHTNEKTALEVYEKIFEKLRTISKIGSKLIIVDCSRRNFYPSIHVKNPFAPTIEWYKHQSPVLWRDLAYEYGFSNAHVDWISRFGFNLIPPKLRWVLSNSITGYFGESLFKLTMTRTDDITKM